MGAIWLIAMAWKATDWRVVRLFAFGEGFIASV
jgi:hypothetical protein